MKVYRKPKSRDGLRFVLRKPLDVSGKNTPDWFQHELDDFWEEDEISYEDDYESGHSNIASSGHGSGHPSKK